MSPIFVTDDKALATIQARAALTGYQLVAGVGCFTLLRHGELHVLDSLEAVGRWLNAIEGAPGLQPGGPHGERPQ